ncbi:MAG: hypothetical protein IJP92_14600 [Lachnospiraceae bacterium]|nr:hypothetical protein [Lachnospiraceae bacterium]
MNSDTWMVILTAIYVITTIAICFANWKSIKELREEQRINIGLQLFSQREEVLEALSKHEYDKIANKVALLFGADYYLRMDSIALQERQLIECENDKKKSEVELAFKKLFTDMVEYTIRSIS